MYSTGYDVNYIIDQNSYAMKLLRKLLSYNGRNELERGNFDFSNDFFSWLIYRVYNKNCNIEVFLEKEKKLTVDTIKGILLVHWHSCLKVEILIKLNLI